MPMKANRRDEITENLHRSAKGYGLSLKALKTCIDSIPEDLLEEFLYTMSRIAEKSDFSALNGDNEIEL